MDTVHEENSPPVQPHYPHLPGLLLNENEHDSIPSSPSSRRPSAIIAALRRPSQVIALSAAHAVMNQRRYFLGLFNGQSDRSIAEKEGTDYKGEFLKKQNRRLGDDALTTILSALYAKLLVVLGMAFPITEIISKDVRPFFYQGFYLYLYVGSISFVAYMYATFVREKAVTSIINSFHKTDKHHASYFAHKLPNKPVKYGSFYLRLGAIAFGIGSMVYSGLEFGRYFELKNNQECFSNVLQAITPATRMVLTLVQVQFIFLNTKNVDLDRHKIIARFGLMHMVATNLCEWLYVLVEETKHEIIHLGEHSNNSTNSTLHHAKYCQEGQVMGSLVTNASPFLFPCTIEYSLICAVILFEMWKKVKSVEVKAEVEKAANSHKEEKVATHYNFNPFGGHPVSSNHHFSVDCSNAHRGLFAGIMVIVLTIISLIMFFVLANEPSGSEEDKLALKSMAEFEVNIVELTLYVLTTVVVIVAMIQMRSLKYDRKVGAEGQAGIGLDNTMLVVAQTGMFIYCMFSVIGCYFTMSANTSTGMLAEIFSFIQTGLQTMFVLDGWWRRCRNLEQVKNKPGKELITFLIIANMAMWTINTLEKNRAEFRPTHLKFFGDWAWTIITHISMPLAIFYRFHSTICLIERLHQSLPTLELDLNLPEVKHRSETKYKYKRGDDVLTFIISAFYAKFIVILGIALPVTDAIATSDYDTYDAFYMYLYIGSIIFLFYMYMIQMKEKSFQESWRRSVDSGESFGNKKNHHVRYGSFYFRMGVTGFGIGSVIYSGLQFGQYFELSSQKDCDNMLKAVKPLLRIIFALMQMLFIFSYSNFLDVQRSKIIARFGLMHMIATNLCEWLFVLIEETQHDIYKSAKKRQDNAARDNVSLSEVDFQFLSSNTFRITKQLYEHKVNCLQSNIMEPILIKSEPYLAPCTVEYSLLCAVILGLMWKNAQAEEDKETLTDNSPEIGEKQSGCNVIYSRRQSQFSVDCAQAHKGLFTGILVLAVTVISLIMFFELVGYKHFKDTTILQVNVWEAVLFWMGTVATVFCIAALRDVGFRQMKRDLELEHLLLLVTQCGVFMYFLFQIIGAVLMGLNKGKGGIMRIITPLSALVQSSCQTVLVLDAWRRRCSTPLQMRRKPGRQLITFLLVANIALWMVNRLKNNRAVSHPNQMDFYGVLAWNIITHVSMPLVVSYRFQSTVCFYEIWKHVYKMGSINNGNDVENR
ncbi:otopetrin-2-like [Asbolus verrucosus]|uniref:Otopetrin-2-like n=1 Tax=Asbolus verrucosus TaxID=1661398 RepID=A0A482VDM3_ASBVE|nr:otopetrin-2-like [Asbolus verrucosus]